MAQQNPNLQLDLPNLSGSEDEAPPASTIYDPAVLALSPEFQAKVDAREVRNQKDSARNEKENEKSPFHVFSPVTDNPKGPFEMGVDGKTIRASSGDVEEAREFEQELCCFGYVPFYPSLILVNIISFILAIVDLSIGSHQVQTGPRTAVGFGSSKSMIISGSHISGIALVSIGILLCLCACFGVTVAVTIWRPPHVRRRWMEMVTHGLLVLVTILSFALFIASTLGLFGVQKDGGAYDATLWQSTVESAPIYTCHNELRLGCSGFARQQCEFDANATSKAFCPGHFCIDFCKIATDDVNPQKVCDPCRVTKRVSVMDVVFCKDHEKAVTNKQSCKEPFEKDLRTRYARMLSAALFSFLSVAATMTVTFYKLCCA